jgi:hypothetical protein
MMEDLERGKVPITPESMKALETQVEKLKQLQEKVKFTAKE